MIRLLMLVEGQSEEAFVKRSLAPYLAGYGVHLERPITLWTKRLPSGGGYRGGVSGWHSIQKSLMPLTKDSDAWVTTLLDFYGLPEDFPGYDLAIKGGDPHQRVLELQTCFAKQVNHKRFIPFLTLHEIEAWMFVDPDAAATHFGRAELAAQMKSIVAGVGNPERINQGPTTHPKERLRKLVPTFKETSDVPTLLEKIGIPSIKAHCPHFAGWLARLESLALAE